jgi:inner membrane protein
VGKAQVMTGPALVAPASLDGNLVNRPADRPPRRATPSSCPTGSTPGLIKTQARSRGIFSIPVYRLDLVVDGEFARPDLSTLGIEPADVAWDRAHLAIGISDARAIQEETTVNWNGRPVPFLPGTGDFAEGGTGIHADVGAAAATERYPFSFPLALNGSLGVEFTPFGRNTVVELQSDYRHPSFQGNWLPVERSVTGAGFTARWSIPFLGRNYPQAWKAEASQAKAIDGSRFGVELVNPVDHYRMADRSVKYAGLFILLTFATIWLIEVLAGVRVHPIQYLMLGEPLPLLPAGLSYPSNGVSAGLLLASVSIVGMVAAYGRVVRARAAPRSSERALTPCMSSGQQDYACSSDRSASSHPRSVMFVTVARLACAGGPTPGVAEK